MIRDFPYKYLSLDKNKNRIDKITSYKEKIKKKIPPSETTVSVIFLFCLMKSVPLKRRTIKDRLII